MNAWANRTRQYTLLDGETGFTIDFAGMKFTEAQLAELAPRFDAVNPALSGTCDGEVRMKRLRHLERRLAGVLRSH